MKCPRCEQENPPQAKFCLECATLLALRCQLRDTTLTGSRANCHCLPKPIALTQITAIAVRSNFSLTIFSVRRSNRMAPPAL